jgi:DNA invertase Pin-like site-specific DNA recombinase
MEGLGATEIARAVGCKRGNIYKALKAGRGHRVANRDIVRLANEGVTRGEIAKRLGVGVVSVYRVLADRKAAAQRAAHNEHLEALSRP